MNNVIEMRPQLKRGFHCLCTDASFGNLHQAWTSDDLDRVLAVPDYFKTLHGSVEPGDTVELFQILPTDVASRHADPLAMAAVAITKIEVDRTGPHVHFTRTGKTLYFDATPGPGLRVAQWNKKWLAYEDNQRIAGPFRLKLEATEVFTHAPTKKYGKDQLMQGKLTDFAPDNGLRTAEQASAKCMPGDIAPAGNRKISRVIQMKTLEPIADVLAQKGDYFSRVRGHFVTSDRLSIVRFSHDGEDDQRVVEVLELAIVDVLPNGELRLYPKSEIEKVGEPETGWKIAKSSDGWTVRRDGRTVQRFPTREHAGWWLDAHTTLDAARVC